MIELRPEEWAICYFGIFFLRIKPKATFIFPPIVPLLFQKFSSTNENSNFLSDPIWMFGTVIIFVLTISLYFPGVLGAFLYMYYMVKAEQDIDSDNDRPTEIYGKLHDNQSLPKINVDQDTQDEDENQRQNEQL
jgi:hypothetical protein